MGGDSTESMNQQITYFGEHNQILAFLEWHNNCLIGNGYQWARREDTFIDLDETEVHPGDFLIITRMDGLDQII